jgi:Lactonase, 7-bladed beta-propeller
MQKWFCWGTTMLALLAVAGVMTGSPRANGVLVESGTIWVTERTTGGHSTVAAIDAATGDDLGTVGVGNNPIGITAPSGTDKVYSSDEDADQVSVIRKDDLSVVQIPVGDRPHHLMASRNGRYVYVAQFGTNTVAVIDTHVDEKVDDLIVSRKPQSRTHAVWISPNGRYLYATNEDSSTPQKGTFSKFDVRARTIVWEYEVGNRPSEVLVDNDTAYVSVRNEHVIKVFDVGGPEPQPMGLAEANFEPDTLSLTNDKRTLIVGLRRNPLLTSARMAFVDTEAINDLSTMIPTYLVLPGVITGHQALSSNGRLTYIALEGRAASASVPGIPGQIAVVDNVLRTLITTYVYPNRNIRPHGVFFEQPRQPELEQGQH